MFPAECPASFPFYRILHLLHLSVGLPNILNKQEPLTKARRKLIRALARKKMRGEHRLFLAEGVRLLDELASIRDRVEFLYGTADGLAGVAGDLRERPAFVVGEEDAGLFLTEHPQGIGAVVRMAAEPTWEEIAALEKPVLLLDGIADPGNAGTILRAAEWFGVGAVLFGNGSVDPYNPKTVRASMGACFRVPVRGNVGAGDILKLERPVYALDKGGALRLGTDRPERRGVFVVGNEAHGLSGFWQGKAQLLAIPGSGSGESLNAAMAAVILCWELSRADQ